MLEKTSIQRENSSKAIHFEFDQLESMNEILSFVLIKENVRRHNANR